MAKPRWHEALPLASGSRVGRGWDRFVALWAALNLAWVAFDLTYVPLRTFWLQRNLYPIPSVPLVLPLQVIPDITPWVDPIKGIEPHRETEAYLSHFRQLDRSLEAHRAGSPLSPQQRQLLLTQIRLTEQMIDGNPFEASGATGTLEKIKNRLRQRGDRDSAKQATALLLDPLRLERGAWAGERRFWQEQVLPLVATNYWRSIDDNGRPTDHFWRYDLVLFQSVFALDILLRAIRMRRRLSGLSWGQALLRRWIDLPLLQSCGLINIEPLRAVISRGVVALLAVELIEVLALQLIDGLQGLIRSRRWPGRIRALRSHQSVGREQRELVELARIWAPLLLARVAPRLAPELQGGLGHALQQSLQNSMVPPALRRIQPILQVEEGISRQLAGGMVDSLIDLTRSTGERLGRRDDQQLELLQSCIDRFWEELAAALEDGQAMEQSQRLLCALLEEFKRSYVSQINRAGIEGLIDELDLLTVRGQGPEAPAIPQPGTP